MKKIFGPLACFVCFATASHAQIAFVDTKFILNKIPDFTDSIAKLNTITAIWQREIDDKQAILEKMYKDFEKDEAMLSDELKKKDLTRYLFMKRNCATCNVHVSDTREISIKKDRKW